MSGASWNVVAKCIQAMTDSCKYVADRNINLPQASFVFRSLSLVVVLTTGWVTKIIPVLHCSASVLLHLIPV